MDGSDDLIKKMLAFTTNDDIYQWKYFVTNQLCVKTFIKKIIQKRHSSKPMRYLISALLDISLVWKSAAISDLKFDY